MTTPHGYWARHDGTGRIVQVGQASAALAQLNAQQYADAEYFTIKPDPDLHYISGGNLLDRADLPEFDKTNITADDLDTATLSGLPTPCDVAIDGVTETITDGVLEIISPMPATYLVEIDIVTHKPKWWEIVAT